MILIMLPVLIPFDCRGWQPVSHDAGMCVLCQNQADVPCVWYPERNFVKANLVLYLNLFLYAQTNNLTRSIYPFDS